MTIEEIEKEIDNLQAKLKELEKTEEPATNRLDKFISRIDRDKSDAEMNGYKNDEVKIEVKKTETGKYQVISGGGLLCVCDDPRKVDLIIGAFLAAKRSSAVLLMDILFNNILKKGGL